MRVKRSNIPKATIIDRRTGEPVDNSPKFISDFSREHAEDKEIVQRINKILIEGDWSYSSLLGKENQTAGKLEWTKSPRDDDFPEVLAVISPEMKSNFKNYGGRHFAHIV